MADFINKEKTTDDHSSSANSTTGSFDHQFSQNYELIHI